MRIYLSGTANLGDFLNGLPVMSGISKAYGKYELTIRHEMKKFKGIKEFLMYQDLFTDVNFDDEVFMYGDITHMSSWPIREDKNDPNRPIETCRYENFMKDNYDMKFEVDDNFKIKYPDFNLLVEQTKPYVGDRWDVNDIDTRRSTKVLSHMNDCVFIDYTKSLLVNCYYIKESSKPFITNLTGISVLADLLNKEQLIIWKSEDWNPEFRNGKDINWDNGKNINMIFEKHFYTDRKSKLVHAKDLEALL
jgi:hypothetical protein